MPIVPESRYTQGKSGVYYLFNTVTLRFYVGSTKNLRSRFNGHLRSLIRNRHCNPKLQNAWNKYGADVWVLGLLEYCPAPELVPHERHWVERLDTIGNGYNLHEPGNAHYGKKPSRGPTPQETKDKISAALKGRKPEMTPARTASIEARRGVKLPHLCGRHHTEATKQKMSKSKLGKPKPAGFGEKIAKALIGKHLPPEVRKKIAEKVRGNQNQLGKMRVCNPATMEARTVLPETATPLLQQGWVRGMLKRPSRS